MNTVLFPKNLLNFQHVFPSSEACAKYLEQVPLVAATAWEILTSDDEASR